MRYVVLLYEACLMLKNIWIFILNVKFDRYCDIVIRIVKELEIDKKFLKFYLKSTSRKYECVVFLLAYFQFISTQCREEILILLKQI